MRYSPSDKPEIIRVVEQSPLPTRRTLEKLGIPRSSFYRWYDRYQRGGPEALADRPSRPDRVWNRIPEAIRSQIVDLALVQPELSPRELAVRFTDARRGGWGRHLLSKGLTCRQRRDRGKKQTTVHLRAPFGMAP
jgi:putative transposase